MPGSAEAVSFLTGHRNVADEHDDIVREQIVSRERVKEIS